MKNFNNTRMLLWLVKGLFQAGSCRWQSSRSWRNVFNEEGIKL